MHEKDEMHIKF